MATNLSAKPATDIRVIVADDHFLVREGIAAVLATTSDLKLVGACRNGAEAIDLHRQTLPDVAIIDVTMPVMDGPTAIAAIVAEKPHACIIALSSYEGDEDIHRALAAGATTYLFKRSLDESLIATIRAIADGQRPNNPAVDGKLAFRAARPVLTAREREVLQWMAAGKANKEIATLLAVSVNTVNTHVANVLAKLAVDDRTQAVTTAAQRGLVRL